MCILEVRISDLLKKQTGSSLSHNQIKNISLLFSPILNKIFITLCITHSIYRTRGFEEELRNAVESMKAGDELTDLIVFTKNEFENNISRDPSVYDGMLRNFLTKYQECTIHEYETLESELIKVKEILEKHLEKNKKTVCTITVMFFNGPKEETGLNDTEDKETSDTEQLFNEMANVSLYDTEFYSPIQKQNTCSIYFRKLYTEHHEILSFNIETANEKINDVINNFKTVQQNLCSVITSLVDIQLKKTYLNSQEKPTDLSKDQEKHTFKKKSESIIENSHYCDKHDTSYVGFSTALFRLLASVSVLNKNINLTIKKIQEEEEKNNKYITAIFDKIQ
ncbi:hypothetical protein CDIK_1603 [Cucumispora dikerogammari]|nr:hypothetical protein CDIK_1603 [Cucumispora dikerogammari]